MGRLCLVIRLGLLGLSSGKPVSVDVVRCGFWHDWRFYFGVEVCDKLVGGIPACVVANFYPIVDPFNPPLIEHWLNGVRVDGVGVCRHFVRSDVYRPVVKHGCYFGGVGCVHSDVVGFGACVGCSRFVRV